MGSRFSRLRKKASRMQRIREADESMNYRYFAVETFTPGPMVEATVQERIY